MKIATSDFFRLIRKQAKNRIAVYCTCLTLLPTTCIFVEQIAQQESAAASASATAV